MALLEGPGDPLVLVNPHASRLHDPATRARVAHDIGQAVTHATGRTPRVVDGEDRVVAELALAEAVASGSPLVVAVGGARQEVHENCVARPGSHLTPKKHKSVKKR